MSEAPWYLEAMAAEGNPWAMRELGERRDGGRTKGRATPTTEAAAEQPKAWSTAEILKRRRRLRPRTPEERAEREAAAMEVAAECSSALFEQRIAKEHATREAMGLPKWRVFPRSQMIAMGWTDAVIAQLLGPADEIVKVQAIGQSIELWHEERVHAAECSKAWWALFCAGKVCTMEQLEAGKATIEEAHRRVWSWEPVIRDVDVELEFLRVPKCKRLDRHILDVLVHFRYEATDYEAFVREHYWATRCDVFLILAGEHVDVRLLRRYPEIAY